jgi:Flp pilus assembly protein TadD
MLTGHVGRNEACPCGSGKRYKDCHGSLGTAAREMPTESERLLQQALTAYRQQNHIAASESCQRILEIDPDDADAWHLLGAIDLQRGDFVSASLKFGKATAREPARAEFHKNLARAQFGSGLAYRVC